MQTSSDRSHVINVLHNLTKTNLVIEEKDPRHKQKKIKKLTPLGEQLAQLMISIEKYGSSYCDLTKTIMENIIVEESDENVLRNKLRGRGLTEDDINRYFYYVIDSYWFLFKSYINMVSALIIRKATILSQFRVNKTANIILDKIISDAISHQLAVMLEYIDNIRKKSKSSVKQSAVTLYLPSPEDFSSELSGSLIHNNKFIDKQANEVLLSLFSVLNPSSSYIEEELERFKLLLRMPNEDKHTLTMEERSVANELKKRLDEERKRDQFVYIKKLKDQMALYEQLLRTPNLS